LRHHVTSDERRQSIRLISDISKSRAWLVCLISRQRRSWVSVKTENSGSHLSLDGYWGWKRQSWTK
jgi:hypothetical protein